MEEFKRYSAKGLIAGEEFLFHFRYPDTAKYYGRWLSPTVTDREGIRVPRSDFVRRKEIFGQPEDAFTEYDLSMYRVCDRLLPKGKCVFHGAAFLWRGLSFIFTAPSGTGKTTQLDRWMGLWKEEIRVMNGDKPILKLEENGNITVLPSPWRGKERWSDDTLSAPLGGVIILEQEMENSIRKIHRGESTAFLFTSILASFEERETVRGSCRIVDRILRTVPVWKLYNRGDEESAELTRAAIEQEGIFDEI